MSRLGDPLTFTATVSGGLPTGNVSFYAGATLLGSSALNGSYQASLTTSSLVPGSSNITAQYAGDANNGPSTSAAVTIQVLGALTPPAAPTNVTATPSSKTIVLGWSGSGDAISYIVKRSLTSGGPYTAIAYTSMTGVTDAPLVNGTPYYYVISATNGAGEGVNSGEISAIPVDQAPVAIPQSVTTAQDTAKAITLAATDADHDALTYVIVTPPAHGALSGSPPNVTYTPAAGFGGADGFTFKANDGSLDSAPATVDITVVGTVTWTNIAPGNWSVGGSWSGGTAPAAGGSASGRLSFNTTPYAGTSTNDLAGTFQLNRWDFGSSLPAMTVSGNALTLVTNVANPPQLNQNGANAVTVANAITLAANATVGGTGAGALTLSGVISGGGGLTKSYPGNLTLSGVNTFSGGVNVTAGTFTIGALKGCGTGTITLAAGTTFQQANFEGNSSAGALPNAFYLGGSGNVIMNMPFGGAKDLWLAQPVAGSAGITVQGGTRTLTLVTANSFSGGIRLTNNNNKVSILNAAALGTGTFRSETTTANSGMLVCSANLYGGSGVTNAFDIASGAYLNLLVDGSNPLFISGPITSAAGAGNLYKAGTATLTLAGTNSYTGTTTVAAGTLALANATSLGHGALSISSGAKLALNQSGSARVATLSLAGVAQANGSWGSSASIASNQNDTYFSGTGVLGVGPATTTSLVLAAGSNPSNPGNALTFTATVTGSSPTGNVYFYAGSTLIGTTALNGTYQASLTTSSLAAGTYDITAQYAGNSGNAASTSAPVTIQILTVATPPAAPTNLIATSGYNFVSLSWTASPGATGYLVKRATVSGGPYATIASPTVTSYADVSVTNGTTYYYVVTATNDAGESANSNEAGATPQQLATTTALVSAPVAAGSYGANVLFTATVTAGATGTVTFRDGASVLAVSPLTSGSATCSLSSLALGGHAISASYGGDATFLGSASAVLTFTVNKLALTVAGVTASSKVYDGTTAAVLSGGNLSGVLTGETVTLIPGSGAFADANVGTAKPVTASGYSLGGANAGNYTLSAQPAGITADITALPVQLAGTRVYDGSATAAAGILSITNNLDGGNLYLTGFAGLTGKDAGARALTTVAAPARVQSKTANTGSAAAGTISMTLNTTPVSGNTLIAVISTRGTSSGRVTGITQTGAAWTRAAQAANSSGTTTEIWYAPNVSGAGTAISIAQASLRSAAVVMEYSGVLTASPLDVTANATGNSSSASTGTTAATSQASELWIGGIGMVNSGYTLSSILNSFTSVASSQTTNSTAGNNAKTYALEKWVSASGTAGTGATVSTSSQWSGAIATFKTVTPTNLALAGSAAGNYSLTAVSGTVSVTPKTLAVSGLSAVNKTYDGGTTAALAGTASLLATETVGSGNAGDGRPYGGDALTVGGTIAGVFADKHVGTLKPVTVTGVTLTGAQAGDYAISQPAGLTANIAQLPVTVTAVTASKVYDGTPAAAGSPVITPALAAGDSTSALSQAFQDVNAGTGNKTIIPSITINDGNGGGNYALTLVNNNTGTISKATATVTLANLSATYDGTPKSATATTVPAGRTVVLTYDGSSAVPVNAGTYAVVGTVSDNNYTGGASGSLVIGKAAATVTLGGLTAIYDGTPKSATATTDPAGHAVTLTYNGSSALPVDAGSYAVVATVNDSNYAGAGSGMLVIQASSVESWKPVHFTPAEITAGLAADDADPDGDGVTNLGEYVMGTDPRVPNAPPVTLTQVPGNQFSLSFFARRATGTGYMGLTRYYTLEATTDPSIPGSWQGVAGYIHIVGDDNLIAIPLANDSQKKFYRLNVCVE